MKKLCLLALCAAVILTTGRAQSLALRGVGGSVGYITASYDNGLNSESLGGFVIGAHADLGEFARGFQLIPEVQYWRTSKTVGGYEWKLSDFAINGNVHYTIPSTGSVVPFIGAGLGLNFISSTIDYSDAFGFGYNGSASSSATRLGVNLLGGANFAAGTMTISPEPRDVLASDFNHLVIKVGVTFPLSR
jgi:hypothetical protein